ncbi:response regulator [Butyrivibrio sp. FC2001]|uniref:response regulator n=1 Tax=Butyrivibrio sp. FC2001 TaxID=1280671 RepID=UPI00041F684D|nr:response regulator [Butyrivibrio sp. FC2001]
MAVILLVDDDEDILAMSGRWLEKAGYEVIKAMSGSEALSALSANKIDLVLLDYVMPDMNGTETLKKIREDERFAELPVILRTGMADNDIEGEVAGLNPQKILPKSEGKGPFLEAVAEALA